MAEMIIGDLEKKSWSYNIIMQKAITGVDAGEEQHLAAAHFDSE